MFPNESMGTYYVPAIKKCESPLNKSIMAKGKLVDKVRNLVRVCDEASPLRKRKCLASMSHDNILEEESITEKVETQDQLWLSLNNEPWAEVIEKWKVTYELRRNNKQANVAEFLNEWPILKDLRSDCLVNLYKFIYIIILISIFFQINLDFQKLHPQKELKLFTNWDMFFNSIYEIKRKFLGENEISRLLNKRSDFSTGYFLNKYVFISSRYITF